MAKVPSKKERLKERLEQSLAAMATFARIREELLLIRMTTPLGPELARLDEMISLNQETLKALNRILAMAEDALTRENTG